MTLASTGAALPLWAVVPPCAILMLVLAGYILALREADVPESRRRIRTAGGIVMMTTLPMIVYLFAIVTPASPRKFMLTWAMLIGLLFMLVVLALVDVLNNFRLHSKMHTDLREELSDIRTSVRDLVEKERTKRREEQAKGDTPELRLTDNSERSDGEQSR